MLSLAEAITRKSEQMSAEDNHLSEAGRISLVGIIWVVPHCIHDKLLKDTSGSGSWGRPTPG